MRTRGLRSGPADPGVARGRGRPIQAWGVHPELAGPAACTPGVMERRQTIASRAGFRYAPRVRRPMAITLLLLGGGAFSAALWALPTRRDECEQARLAQRPDAEEICSRAASSRSSSSTRTGFWAGSTGSSSGTTTTTSSSSSSSRGGFGSTASSGGG